MVEGGGERLGRLAISNPSISDKEADAKSKW